MVFFGQFLEVYGEEYRKANPDEEETIGTMSRKFNTWLHGLQDAEELTKFEEGEIRLIELGSFSGSVVRVREAMPKGFNLRVRGRKDRARMAARKGWRAQARAGLRAPSIESGVRCMARTNRVCRHGATFSAVGR